MSRLLMILTLALPLLAGCGNSSEGTLTGTVTVNGKPLKRGSVRLDPEGAGTPVGSTVLDGRYEIRGAKPGKYKLHVDGEPESAGPVKQEDVMKRSNKEHAAATENPVPANATGNDEPVTVAGGTQTHDVKLVSPEKK